MAIVQIKKPARIEVLQVRVSSHSYKEGYLLALGGLVYSEHPGCACCRFDLCKLSIIWGMQGGTDHHTIQQWYMHTRSGKLPNYCPNSCPYKQGPALPAVCWCVTLSLQAVLAVMFN